MLYNCLQMRTEFGKFASGRTTVAVSLNAVDGFRGPIQLKIICLEF